MDPRVLGFVSQGTAFRCSLENWKAIEGFERARGVWDMTILMLGVPFWLLC